jgi:flagellar motor switch protein FliN/FliY
MAGESDRVDQDEIEQLLKQAQGGAGASAPGTSSPASTSKIDQDELDALLAASGIDAGKTSAPAAASSDPATMKQAEIEALLSQQRGQSGATKKPPAGTTGRPASDVEFLLSQAEQALASVNQPNQDAAKIPVAPFRFQDFGGAPPSTDAATIDLIRDVELDVKIELGRTNMYLEDVLRLKRGSVVSLDKLAGDPVDIYVNGRLIARGEVLVLNDNFCVRVAELVTGDAAAA